MSFLQFVILPVLGVAIIFALIRLIQGPSLPDRVVALDLMATLGIGVIAVSAITTNHPVLLDIATVVALLSFLGTVAFAFYIERRV